MQLLRVEPLEGKTSISIDQVHDLAGQLIYRALGESPRIVIISPAEKLTLPAQQALLKTLEEPPENTQIILVTEYREKLLPTILSRAVVFHDASSIIHIPSASSSMYEQLQTQNITACLKLSDEWSKSKEETIEKLRKVLAEIRQQSHTNESYKILHDEKAIITCIEQLEKNVHAKLVLDHLFLILSQHIR